jgi:hypothetical protein
MDISKKDSISREKSQRKEKRLPKTLEESLSISESEKIGGESPQTVKPPPASTKPIDVITTGPKIPVNWRKMEELPEWKRQKFALIEKFQGERWDPKKKLSREEMRSVKVLKESMPELTNSDLSQHFQVSPEAIRRILKSNWKPTEAEADDVFDRWKKRGVKIKTLLNEKELSLGFSTPKVIIGSGKDYNKVTYSRNGDIPEKPGPKTVDTDGASFRIRRLNSTNKLRKMKF